jgi:hypothetical protein
MERTRPLLPLALIAVLFGIAVLLAQIAPRRAAGVHVDANGLLIGAIAVIGLLTAAAGTAAYFLGGRFRLESRWRWQAVIGTGLLGMVMFGVGGSVVTPEFDQQSMVLLAPLVLVAVAALAGWQWQVSGLGGGSRGARWGYALGAAAATAAYAGVAVLVLLVQSGFLD